MLDLAHQIRWDKHTLSGRVISHLWCVARLEGIAHHSFYSVGHAMHTKKSVHIVTTSTLNLVHTQIFIM